MIKYENECVDCPEGIGCSPNTCPYLNVPYLYCDECGDEVDELYDYDGAELCQDCIIKSLRKTDPYERRKYYEQIL